MERQTARSCRSCRKQQAVTLSAEARQRILGLAEQLLSQIWKDPRLDFRERNRLLRLLLDDVTRRRRSPPMCGCPAGYAHVGWISPSPCVHVASAQV
jgi:hypothetical protein